MEMAVRAVPVFGRPRGFSIFFEALVPKISGNTSAAGRALAKVALVHLGFSVVLLLVVVLRFIVSRLAAVGLPQNEVPRSAMFRSSLAGSKLMDAI
jgi:hypothetical protein